MMTNYVLLLNCQDRPGILKLITNELFERQANILNSDQHSTTDQNPHFFLRMVFESPLSMSSFQSSLTKLRSTLSATVQLHDLAIPIRSAVLVSSQDHCLQELLVQWASKSINIHIDVIISNHDNHQAMSNWYNVPFYYVPSDSKPESERELLAKTRNTDLLIMARYMQILSPQFLSEYRRPVVNIHHSFLPSFTGARPYHQAIERGVKLIGATAHFATNELDEGPIITQKVAPVTHRHCLKDLIEIGKYLEKKCLLDAVQQISEHRVMVYQNKTIVFE